MEGSKVWPLSHEFNGRENVPVRPGCMCGDGKPHYHPGNAVYVNPDFVEIPRTGKRITFQQFMEINKNERW